MRPYFSVVVPVYRARAYLAACVDSILAQSFADFELILVDDGSPDGCGALCDEYAGQDSRVRAVHQANAGPTPARRRGLELARADYVCFVDSDDWVLPHWLETVHSCIEENGRPDMVLFDLRRNTDKPAQPLYAAPGYYDRARMERELWPTMLCDVKRQPFGQWQLFPGYLPTKVFRRELLEEHFVRDGRITMFEDAAMAYECVYFARSVYISGEKLYVYRVMDESNLNHYRSAYFQEMAYLQEYLRKHLGALDSLFPPQINAFLLRRLVNGFADELVHGPDFSAAVAAAGKALDESGFARHLDYKGLPLSWKLFLFLTKNRLYRLAGTMVRLRMDGET